MLEISKDEGGPIEERVARYRGENRAAGRWAAGCGAIRHSVETQARVFAPAKAMASSGVEGDGVPLFEALLAAARAASAAMWLVVHATDARNVWLDGRDLAASDFTGSGT